MPNDKDFKVKKGVKPTVYHEKLGTVVLGSGTATLDLSTGSVFQFAPTSNIQLSLSNPAASGTVSGATLLLEGADPSSIDSVFSTSLYTGNSNGSSGTQTITNGIDLAGEGGLVWIKSRIARGHALFDTARGPNAIISSEASTAESSSPADLVTAFNSNGFSLGVDSFWYRVNRTAENYASWTFRKAPRFFDVVTYTGTGANRTIAHDLGVVPGCIIVKRRDTTGDWQVYHRSLANTEYTVLNSTAAKATGATRWNSTTPTSSVFSLGTDATVNASGGTYVAYLFAHDPFGSGGLGGKIACGSYTGNGSATGPTVDLGWQPQWLLVKNASAVGDWALVDSMRGFGVSTSVALEPNSSGAESTATNIFGVRANGFQVISADTEYNASGNTCIYIAIRGVSAPTITYDSSIDFPGNLAPTSPAIGQTDVLIFNTRDGGANYNAALAIDGAS